MKNYVETKFQKFIESVDVVKTKPEDLKCPVCGGKMYKTDGGRFSTYHCKNAKFWEFNRGTEEQKKAHKHFYDSTTYVELELA